MFCHFYFPSLCSGTSSININIPKHRLVAVKQTDPQPGIILVNTVKYMKMFEFTFGIRMFLFFQQQSIMVYALG